MWLRLILGSVAAPVLVLATLCCPKNGRAFADDVDAVSSMRWYGITWLQAGHPSAPICLGADIKVATTLKPRLSDLGIKRHEPAKQE